jgi:uncharacterized protein (DUF433 family)
MTRLETTQNAPLTLGEDGTIRISGSRVSLDSVVHQFKLGATAEQIQEDLPSLTLREIYGAIYYYLEHEAEVEEYLRRQEQAAAETRRLIDNHPGSAALRERLRARRQTADR